MGRLADIMTQCHGIDIDEAQERLLMDDLHAIMKVNETMNLTRILSEEGGIVLHLEDSLTGLPFVEDAPEGAYADLGTGGGFPGMPMCVMTGRQTLLVDSVQKKVRALEGVASQLGLGDKVDVYAGRIEDLGRERAGEFSVLTARALSALGSLMELASPLLKRGGRLVCYKAQPSEEELSCALGIQDMVGLTLKERRDFSLSDGSTRCIFVFEKTGKPRVKLPRRVGLAQKDPLRPR
ncbi:16S rRNA (guanine(527)-N(7))-methyltransferase RsmG [Slackia faecicanis]|uniref:Ribosomal RNA small subunit methyltransferase G n=1 Tax=Slackia faecicanis TaxID=255723 RepID=A0A3N0AEF3_9ACTN|nr:16S rRNA (guanine(527)-N(7))-methyltransferase RsmG [Slackia faecicanis]MDO5358051.1 16S rRNA (guanine(527)-N(7))-methyltransferase RsmG [Slackia faecicanis]RNL18681.1 16S rRNA (guanine(527)-N(7))-methyltransferase RsmG [Slackia faecicanis]